VVIRPNRGAVVQAFDQRSALNLYELRELLEVEAVRQAALVPERDLRKAERLLDELTQLHEADDREHTTGQRHRRARIDATSARQPGRAGAQTHGLEQALPDRRTDGRPDGRALLWPVDVAFHRAVHEIGPNHLLADLAERTHRQIQAIRARAGMVATGTPGRSNVEHTALLEAIRRRDPDEAAHIIRQHIRAVRDRVLPALNQVAI
jgi:DNA-binding GntR family transcriptional regulator